MGASTIPGPLAVLTRYSVAARPEEGRPESGQRCLSSVKDTQQRL